MADAVNVSTVGGNKEVLLKESFPNTSFFCNSSGVLEPTPFKDATKGLQGNGSSVSPFAVKLSTDCPVNRIEFGTDGGLLSKVENTRFVRLASTLNQGATFTSFTKGSSTLWNTNWGPAQTVASQTNSVTITNNDGCKDLLVGAAIYGEGFMQNLNMAAGETFSTAIVESIAGVQTPVGHSSRINWWIPGAATVAEPFVPFSNTAFQTYSILPGSSYTFLYRLAFQFVASGGGNAAGTVGGGGKSIEALLTIADFSG